MDYDGSFFSGVKSDLAPTQVPLGYAWMAMNMINIGGLLSCRPGYRCLFTLPDGNLQGATIFRPQLGIEQIIFAIDGLVYASPWPFVSFTQIQGLQFSPFAKQLYWSMTLQSAARTTNAFVSPIQVITPKSVLMIQDGGFTGPGWYDGQAAGHVVGSAFETPSGGPMQWVGDRLWVASGNQLFASDISNPFSFREQIYLGGVSSFFFNSTITAMAKTPSVESPQLMVFTDLDGSLIQANIRDRNSWPTTVNFQVEIVQVGCLSQRSLTSHYGNMVWYSPSGVAIYDPATSGKLTARLPMRDNEMLVSKATLSDDLSTVAAGVFGQFLMFSVPAEDNYNRHTWVLNHASLTTLSDDSGPSWSGYWTGTRPVEWVYGQFAGVERIFYVSKDHDQKNRLWEAFQPNRLDNGCPITWAFWSRGYFGMTAPNMEKAPGSRCRLAWADLGLTAIAEDLDIGMFYAGSTRGEFKQMMAKTIRVDKGSLSFDRQIGASDMIFAYKPQSRKLRSEDVNQKTSSNDSSCDVEQIDLDHIDTDFQFLVVGHGPATVKYVRPFGFTVAEDFSGDGRACQAEEDIRASRFDGVGANAEDSASAEASLNAAPEQFFFSRQAVSVTQLGYVAVGVGEGKSIVSQAAADRVANIIAQKQAENELMFTIPPSWSEGLTD